MGSSAFPLSGPPPPITTRSSPPPTILSWRLPRKQLPDTFLRRSDRQAFVVCANANTSRRNRSSRVDIIMVDPLEAKRLAAKQMQEIQAKDKFKRRCRIEAINGAWAMVGLTAGLVVEGQTGKGILGQLAGYWASVTSFFAG